MTNYENIGLGFLLIWSVAALRMAGSSPFPADYDRLVPVFTAEPSTPQPCGANKSPLARTNCTLTV